MDSKVIAVVLIIMLLSIIHTGLKIFKEEQMFTSSTNSISVESNATNP